MIRKQIWSRKTKQETHENWRDETAHDGLLIMLAERIFLSALTSPPGDEPMENEL
jgi:hypothetical protein